MKNCKTGPHTHLCHSHSANALSYALPGSQPMPCLPHTSPLCMAGAINSPYLTTYQANTISLATIHSLPHSSEPHLILCLAYHMSSWPHNLTTIHRVQNSDSLTTHQANTTSLFTLCLTHHIHFPASALLTTYLAGHIT